MSGASKSVKSIFFGKKDKKDGVVGAAVAQAQQVAAQKQVEVEEFAKRRGRRVGRALLSEARLSPEEGVSTLGQTVV